MGRNTNSAGEIRIVGHHKIGFIHQFVEHKISEPYNADEVKAGLTNEIVKNEDPKSFHKSAGERREDKRDLAQGGYLNTARDNSFAVDLSHQYKEIPSENLSWFDYILFTVAGIVMGIMIFGALL